jgi:hypothetical protein
MSIKLRAGGFPVVAVAFNSITDETRRVTVAARKLLAENIVHARRPGISNEIDPGFAETAAQCRLLSLAV